MRPSEGGQTSNNWREREPYIEDVLIQELAEKWNKRLLKKPIPQTTVETLDGRSFERIPLGEFVDFLFKDVERKTLFQLIERYLGSHGFATGAIYGMPIPDVGMHDSGISVTNRVSKEEKAARVLALLKAIDLLPESYQELSDTEQLETYSRFHDAISHEILLKLARMSCFEAAQDTRGKISKL